MSALRLCLRLAWRDILRHKGRSLLIVALVALPVVVIGAADVLFRSTQVSVRQAVDGQLAGSSAYLSAPVGADPLPGTGVDQWPHFTASIPVSQLPPGAVGIDAGDGTTQLDLKRTALRPAEEILPLLPTGSSMTRWDSGQVPVAAGDSGRYRIVAADLLDLASPASGRRYVLESGRLPSGPDVVMLTESLAADLGVRLGDTVSVGSPAAEKSVVGLVRATIGGNRVQAVVGLPGSIAGLPGAYGPRYLVTSPQQWTESVAQTLARNGIGAYSRDLALAWRAPDEPQDPTPERALALATAVILAALALTQVVFLSGPAFAIAARKMRRQLGLAGANGATPAQLGNVVLLTGLVLGVIGSVAGTTVGAAAGALLQPAITTWTGIDFPFLNINLRDLTIIAGLGAVTSLLAAAWPAITARRLRPIDALSKRAQPIRKPGLTSLAGLVIAGIGIALCVWTATQGWPDTMEPAERNEAFSNRLQAVAAGLLICQVGLVIGAPQIVALLGRLGAVLPTGPRLALRSSARYRGRSAGAIATILVAATGAVVGAAAFATLQARADAQYSTNVREGLASGRTWYGADESSIDPAALQTTATKLWPGARSATWSVAVPAQTEPGRVVDVEPSMPAGHQCPWIVDRGGPGSNDDQRQLPTEGERAQAAVDRRCAGASYSSVSEEQAQFSAAWGRAELTRVVVGDAELRHTLTGLDDPVADAALAAGKLVVLDWRYLDQGQLHLQFTTADLQTGEALDISSRFVPAVQGKWALSPVVAIIPESALPTLGLTAQRAGFVIDIPHPTKTDAELLPATVAAAGADAYAWLEIGPAGVEQAFPSAWLILWVAVALIIGIVLVVTALGVVDNDDESATLAATGATSRLRRTMSGWSALTTTAIGCILGAGSGLVVVWAMFQVADGVVRQPGAINVPWAQVAILVIGLPIVAWLLAALFTRSRIQLIRRAE